MGKVSPLNIAESRLDVDLMTNLAVDQEPGLDGRHAAGHLRIVASNGLQRQDLEFIMCSRIAQLPLCATIYDGIILPRHLSSRLLAAKNTRYCSSTSCTVFLN